MKGDFSRSSFDPQKHYTSVRMQQGRVQLDADWNEQADIMLHQLRGQLEDLIGKAGIPSGYLFSLELDFVGELDAKDQVSENLRAQFQRYNVALASPTRIEVEQTGRKWTVVSAERKHLIQKENQTLNVYLSDFLISHVSVSGEQSQLDFKIGAGRCYVDGILCINEKERQFTDQEAYPGAGQEIQTSDKAYIVYLDVWDRHVTVLEDPDIREPALEGVDTATRTKTVWQVKLEEIEAAAILPDEQSERQEFFEKEWRTFIEKSAISPKLTAHLAENALIQQNQLYRVEIHQKKDDTLITFKWSRENGSVAYSIEQIDNKNPEPSVIKVTQTDPGRLDIEVGDWVEIVDDSCELRGITWPLVEVVDVQRDTGEVTVNLPPAGTSTAKADTDSDLQASHTVLRRWDGQQIVDGAVEIGEPAEFVLENGITVSFTNHKHANDCDYWLIPARANLNDGKGGIIWPPKDMPQPPHGIEHHYAPLATIQCVAEEWEVHDWKPLRFRDLPTLTTEVDEHGCRITAAEDAIDKLIKRVTTTEADISKLTERVTTTEADISKLTEWVTTTEADISKLTERVQSLEEKTLDLRRVEWLMAAMAVLLLLSFALMFFAAKDGRWFVAIILLIGGGLFWAWQKLRPSKGDGTAK